MRKQIIINNIKRHNDCINSCNSNNIKSIKNNVIKETKKSYIELQENLTTKTDDLSFNILEFYDNYDKQLASIINIYKEFDNKESTNKESTNKESTNKELYEKQHFLQSLKKKLAGYKQQDIKKTYDEYANFITLTAIIEKLVLCNMKCYYCNNNTLILFKNVREQSQWTLDRLNNYDEHSNANTVICCLKCNLQKRRKNSTKFKFSKLLNIVKKIE